ncbi:MAG: M48 family metallopeptidase [Saprospiraceae bacterium]|nr:M48 family metallopeptidase [Saprospiraceae bacterium]
MNKRNGATLILALVLAGFSYFKYCSTKTFNEYTQQYQHVGISADQEIALGLNSAPSMIQQYGGLHPDQRAQDLVKAVGNRLVQNTIAAKTPYQYNFHLLADGETINAFALPGGQVFITTALFTKLENEDQLAGVLGHEIGHVIARHGGERITQNELFQGLSGATTIATGDHQAGQSMAAVLNQFFAMPYGREQELQSDDIGVHLMLQAGYNPEALIGVMEILKASAGPDRIPERMSTHPDPENRMAKIREAIEKYRSQTQ